MSGLDELNELTGPEARWAFLRCCGSAAWAEAMAAARPFASEQALFDTAVRVWRKLHGRDWLEAFAAHPRIGVQVNGSDSAKSEQSGVRGATEESLRALADGNRRYEKRFGHIFLICATGKGADEMLAALKDRLANDRKSELRIAGQEQEKITKLRLERLLAK